MNRIALKLGKMNYRVSELYKKVRTNIQFCGDDKKVIAMTSCLPGEGESEASLQLAVSFAEAGKKTVIIDGNMRKSSVIDATRKGQKVNGLMHYLLGKSELKDIIYMSDIPDLYIIYSGDVLAEAADLLDSENLEVMLNALRKVYDYIIISTPPVGRVIDGAIIASKCDGSVIVFGSGMTDYRIAQDVKEQLERSGVSVLGAILNKADKRHVLNIEKYGKYGKHSMGGTEQ